MTTLFYIWWFGFWAFVAFSFRAQSGDDWRWDLAAVTTAAIWPLAIVWQLRRNQ